jgi:hypothetical protein
MPGLESVAFATDGWTLFHEDELSREWRNSSADVLSVHYFAKPPDIAGPLSRMDIIRNDYRAIVAQSGGSLVEVQGDELGELTALRTILKFPQDPHGMSYIGAWTIPRDSFSFVIKICCAEHGTTGFRDSTVWARLHSDGELKLAPDDPLANWFQDPYDSTVRGPTLRNRADDEKWDPIFPQHPLSRARTCMAQIRRSIQFDESVRGSEPFLGPGRAAGRTNWWGRLTGR